MSQSRPQTQQHLCKHMLTISRLLYLVLTRLTLWLNFKAWSHQGSTQIGPTQCKCFMSLWTTRSSRWRVEHRDKEWNTEWMTRGDTFRCNTIWFWCNTRWFNTGKYCSHKALHQHNTGVRPDHTPQNIKATLYPSQQLRLALCCYSPSSLLMLFCLTRTRRPIENAGICCCLDRQSGEWLPKTPCGQQTNRSISDLVFAPDENWTGLLRPSSLMCHIKGALDHPDGVCTAARRPCTLRH